MEYLPYYLIFEDSESEREYERRKKDVSKNCCTIWKTDLSKWESETMREKKKGRE